MLRLILCVLLLLSPHAYANSSEISDQLQRVETTLEIKKSRIERIENKTHAAEGALKTLQRQMVKTAADIQQFEGTLTRLQQEEIRLQANLDKSKQELLKANRDMSLITSAGYRLSQRPLGLSFLKPGDRLETARMTDILGRLTPQLQDQAQAKRAEIEEFALAREKLLRHRQDIYATRSSLKERHSRLSSMVKDRQSLLRKGRSFLKEETAALRALSAKAASLQDILKSLPEAKNLTAIPGHNKKLDHLRLPVSGIIHSNFGQTTHFGGRNSGIEILTGADALVVAPHDGTVRYTGNFMDYDGVVILEHAGGYHSLLAGLQEISILPGQTIVSGEPIGIIKNGDSGVPFLYYELRRSGRPIDPQAYF